MKFGRQYYRKQDRSHRIGGKKDGQRASPIIVKLVRYNTRK